MDLGLLLRHSRRAAERIRQAGFNWRFTVRHHPISNHIWSQQKVLRSMRLSPSSYHFPLHTQFGTYFDSEISISFFFLSVYPASAFLDRFGQRGWNALGGWFRIGGVSSLLVRFISFTTLTTDMAYPFIDRPYRRREHHIHSPSPLEFLHSL